MDDCVKIDDLIGEYPSNSEFPFCFHVIKNISQGTFGKVVEVQGIPKACINYGGSQEKTCDSESGNTTLAAIAKSKSITNPPTFTFVMKIISDMDSSDFENELTILQKIKVLEEENKTSFCIGLCHHFENELLQIGCFIFPKLGITLKDFKSICGIYSLDNIREIGTQLLSAVRFLHNHNILHTDIHDGNILFVEPNNYTQRGHYKHLTSTNIKLIDFGHAIDTSVCDQQEDQEEKFDNKQIITIRSNRAPEVILKLGWSKPAEMWSIGCTIYGLFKGDILGMSIGPRDDMKSRDIQSLAIMERMFGLFPESMRNDGYAKSLFTKDGHVGINFKHVCNKYISYRLRLQAYNTHKTIESNLLFDILSRMLKLNPMERISIDDALKHEFFNRVKTVKEVPKILGEGDIKIEKEQNGSWA